MTQALAKPHDKSRQTLLVVWAVVATVIGVVSSGLAVFLLLQRGPQPSIARSTSPFLDLPESAIPGRYKWIDKSGESFITLLEDHTFINRDGTTYPVYRWEITRDALWIVWQRSHSHFARIEAPGVYVAIKSGVEVARIEKQE